MEKKLKPAVPGLIRKHQRVSNSRRLFLLMLGLTMSSLMSHQAAAADHIEIVREILLEGGHPATPKQLAATNGGGIVVAGSFSNHIPWATRVDSDGKVRWRYVMPMEQWRPGHGDASYESGATLPDDSTVLSGFRSVSVPGKSTGDVVGLLTHLDQSGKVVSQQQLYPQGDHSFPLNYLRRSVPWGDGIAVIGHTLRWRKVADDYVEDDFLWLIALNAKGEIQWEKLISVTYANSQIIGAVATPGHELVVVTSGSIRRGTALEHGRQVMRFNDRGEIVGERYFPGSFLPTHQVNSEPEITLVSDALGNGTLWRVTSDLANATQFAGNTEWIFARAACRSLTGSLLLAGDLQGTHKAAIEWVDADLRSTQTHVFQPEDASYWVADVLPTRNPDEFVTVRAIVPGRGFGVALTFVKVK